MKNILEMLEKTTQGFAQKTAFADDKNALTFAQLQNSAKAIGSALCSLKTKNRPVAVLLPRSVFSIAAMLGVAYSGNFYVVIDDKMPADRIASIFNTLSPAALITNEACFEKANSLEFSGKIFDYDESVKTEINQDELNKTREDSIATDPLYALFTSGSTGVPKGAVVSHSNVLAYSKWFSQTFDISNETVFGSQTPFYFSMSVSDVFATIRTGATLQIIQKQLFSFPLPLLQYLNDRSVNTIYWVPSALSIIANLKALDYCGLPLVKKVLFAGEVMPAKQLNYWMDHVPDAVYANLFGPTETTDICTYFVVNRRFKNEETLPIGKACNNCDVFVVKDDGTLAREGEEGELFARGPFVAMGYYANPEKTAAAFVQNPLNPYYPETVYKTGDLVKQNEQGELIYITRKDFQIKRAGYRIELGEIEAAAGAAEGVTACAAIYDEQCDKIILVYQGKTDDAKIVGELKKHLPAYMMPNLLVKTRNMPYNQNGKIDRKRLKAEYKTIK